MDRTRAGEQTRTGSYLWPGIAAAAGILTIVIGIIVGVAGNKAMRKFMETAETATAAITDIRNIDDSREVIVSFITKDGVRQEGKLGAYNSAMQVGGAVTVYYDPLNPAQIKTGQTYNPQDAVLTVGLGLAFVIIGIFAAIKERGNQDLRTNGECYEAHILGCPATGHAGRDWEDVTYTYVLVCQYMDRDGVLRKCRSRVLSEDPRPQLPNGTVAVYVDPGKPKKYFVDVEGSMSGSAI